MTHQARLVTQTMPRIAHASRSTHVDERLAAFVVPRHWGMHIYRYAARVSMDGVPMKFEAGWAGFTPPGARMEYDFRGNCVHVFAHLEWPSEAEPDCHVPFLFDVGAEFELLWSRLEAAISLQRTNPLRANVRAWDVLLQLVEISQRQQRVDTASHTIDHVFRLIESHLAESLTVEDLARRAGVSPSHLRRLFRERENETVVGTIQRLRMERARHLIQQTTLPLKEIAVMVGVPDLQHFNKSVRKAFQVPPSKLRS